MLRLTLNGLIVVLLCRPWVSRKGAETQRKKGVNRIISPLLVFSPTVKMAANVVGENAYNTITAVFSKSKARNIIFRALYVMQGLTNI